MPKGADGQFLAGDVRAGENSALTSLHTLFVHEHNRVVEALLEERPDLTDDEAFALARRVVEAEVQSITFNAFLPKLLGDGAVSDQEATFFIGDAQSSYVVGFGSMHPSSVNISLPRVAISKR